MKGLRCLLFITLLIALKPATALGGTYTWTGTALLDGNNWRNGGNWTNDKGLLFLGTTPTANDDVVIQSILNVLTLVYLDPSNYPIIPTGETDPCKSVTVINLPAASITVNGSGLLAISGAFIQEYSTNRNVGLTLTGTGTITCASFTIGVNNTVVPNAIYVGTTKCNIKTFTVNGAITANSMGSGTTKSNNAVLNIDNDNVDCTVTAASLNITNTNLNTLASARINLLKSGSNAINLVLKGATPLLIANNGTNGGIDFYPTTGTGTSKTTVEYAGTIDQAVYTENLSGLDAAPAVYQHIKFSGALNKNIAAGNLSIFGDWTSTGSTVVVNTVLPTIIFKGTAPETLTDAGTNNGNGVVFQNVTFQGDTLKTISGTTTSAFSIANTGVLTMAGNSTRLTVGLNGTLTLISNVGGTAAVAKIPNYCRITGNVSVQRFINSGSIVARNYRLLSSPVNTNGVIGNANSTAYNILTYLTTANTGVFVGGQGGPTNGFTVTNANPTIYMYKESRPASNTTFNSGNFKGLTYIKDPMKGYDDAGTGQNEPVTLYAGNGFMLYYVGNNSTSTLTLPPPNKQTKGGAGNNYMAPDASTTTAIGTLNQGKIPVKLWYTGGTTQLTKVQTGYSLMGNPYAATIDWNTFSNTDPTAGIYAPNVSDVVYEFNYTNKNYSTFQAHYTSTNGATNLIASGQGFFVKATDPTQATLTFNEAAKITTGITSPILFMGLPAQVDKPLQILHVKLAKDSVNTDEIALVFEDKAQNEFEQGRDVVRLNGMSNVATMASYASQNTQQLAINHLHSIDSTTRVKLYVNSTGAAAINTLSVTGFSSLDPRYDVFLIDHYKNDSLQVSLYEKYNFNLSPDIAATFGNSRFELVFHKKSGLNYRLLSFTGALLNHDIQLKWTTQFEQNLTGFTLEKADASGNYNPVYSIQSNGTGAYSWTDKAPFPGINAYRLKQIDAFDNTTYSKIISINLTNAGEVNPPIMIYPNPVVGQFNLKLTMPALPNQLLMKVIGLNGQTLISKTWSGDTTQQSVGNLLPGTYIVEVSDNSTKQLIGRVKISKP